MNLDRELDKKHSSDPRSPYFNDGFKPQVKVPRFIDGVRGRQLQPMRNRANKVPSTLHGLNEFKQFIWGCE